jgi:hypothetical protein
VKARLLEIALWTFTAAALAEAGSIWYGALHRRFVPSPTIWPVQPLRSLATSDSLGVLAERTVSGDAFRLERKPALVAYRQRADTQPARAAASAPPKPALALAGVVGGPPWAALLDGVPGHDASVVVHQGDSIAGFHIRRIAPNAVVITGLDTTWRLVVKRVWQ